MSKIRLAIENKNMLNMILRMPIVLQKSCSEKSIRRSFFIPDITDGSQQGPDVDCIMATYKKELTIDLKNRLIDEALLQIKEFRSKGRFVENISMNSIILLTRTPIWSSTT